MRAVTDGRYKYIRNFSKRPDMPTVKEFEGMDIKHMGDYWSASSKRTKPLEELYDLAKDPHETVNLADSADHQKVRERMTQELYRWMYRTNDFLRGADLGKGGKGVGKVPGNLADGSGLDSSRPTYNHWDADAAFEMVVFAFP